MKRGVRARGQGTGWLSPPTPRNMKESDAVRPSVQPVRPARRVRSRSCCLMPNNGMPAMGHPAPCRAVAFVGRGCRGATCTVPGGVCSQCRGVRARGRAAAPRQAERSLVVDSFRFI